MERVRRVKNEYAVTLPTAVRRALRLRPGDHIAFAVKGETVVITNARMRRLRQARMRANPMRDWDTPEDDEAFRTVESAYARTRVFSGS